MGKGQGKDGTEILAIPEPGYHFVGWSDGSTNNPRTDREVTGNIAASAEFAINTYTVSYDTRDQGSVYGPPPQVLDHGSFGGSVIAVPAEGYHFAQWNDGVSENPRTEQKVTGNITVTAEYALNQYRLSYSAENGSIEGNTPQTIGHGNDGTEIKAVSDEGYRFVKWSDGSTDNPRTDTSVTADITVEAEFERVTFSGKVILTEPDFQSFPVPEALVTLVSQSADASYTTLTDEDGRFFFHEIPGEDYSLTVTSDGLTSITQDVTLEGGVSRDLGTLPAMNFEAMYNQEQLDKAVLTEKEKWDQNGDGKYGLPEAIKALQISSGTDQE